MQLIFITVQGRHLFKKTTFTVSTLPRAWLEPRANRMLVMKVLRQDVAILAFHPHDALRGLKTHGTALSFVPPKTFCYSRKCFGGTSSAQSQSQESPPSVPTNDVVLLIMNK